jgi:hypothetical protein
MGAGRACVTAFEAYGVGGHGKVERRKVPLSPETGGTERAREDPAMVDAILKNGPAALVGPGLGT